jgi:hypothetical protein
MDLPTAVPPRSLFAAIWVCALAGGLLTVAVTAVIGALVDSPGPRADLQWAAAVVVVVVSGVACFPLLARLQRTR